MIEFNILTIFPDMLRGLLEESMLKRAIEAGHVRVNLINFRDYTLDKHRRVDDAPFGGGAGMLIMPQPVFDCFAAVAKEQDGKRVLNVYMSPAGDVLNAGMSREIAEYDAVNILCGHYEGVDQRIIDELIDREISIGDYVLTGGELPAMVLLDSVIVEQTMYAMKTLELSQTGLIQGTPKEGYEIKKISMTPENITVAGWSSEMTEIDALFTDATIDVSGLSDSVKQRVRLSSVPELKYVSATYVNVTIEIGPVLKSKSFTNLPIQIEGLEAGYNASMSRVNASVMITAPQNWLNALQSRDIRLVCDASGLAPGTYSLPVLCRIDADEDEEISVEVVPGNVSVTITVE